MAGHGIANCIRPQRLVCGARLGWVRTYSGTPGTKLSTHSKAFLVVPPSAAPNQMVLITSQLGHPFWVLLS